jgi:5,6-dimethylbenzimidazole synthase
MKAFTPKERKGVYRAIFSRWDACAFRPDPIPPWLLARLLQAAHQSPSVGLRQPWNFIVITNTAIKQQVHALVRREKEYAAIDVHGEHREVYRSLTLEGILNAPINLCITCDPSRFGPRVIGRQPIHDFFSVCCAIENLRLVARAEGIGVGWVSILRNRKLREILAIPEPIVPVAYLCLGYPVSFPDRSVVATVDRAPRLKLTELVYVDTWDRHEGMDDLVRYFREGVTIK